MAGVEVTIDAPNEGSIKVRFDQFDAEMKQKLLDVIKKAGGQLFENVRQAAPEATGSLKSHIETNFAEGEGWARVYVEAQPEHDEPFNLKAAALEYGSRGKRIDISGYSRTLDQIFGEATAPFEQSISAYQRTPNIDEYRFLRGAFGGLEESFRADVEAALSDAASAFNE